MAPFAVSATGGGSGNLPTVQELLALARSRGRLDSPGVQGPLARWYAQQQGMKYLRMRSLTALSRGETPGQEGAILKLTLSRLMQELSSFAFDLEDQRSVALAQVFEEGLAGAALGALALAGAVRVFPVHDGPALLKKR